MSDKVQILLPTYNGCRYLPELLGSVLAQTYSECLITIRDDSSTDGSYSFLADWARGKDNVQLSRGDRLGPADSFFTLLQDANWECEYFAFCDQDDVWRPEKIGNAVAMMRAADKNRPLLYCSRIEYVDSRLRHLGYSPRPRRISFSNALVENIATGCTMVINRAARELLIAKGRLPRYVIMYDVWCYLVISSLGEVIFDPGPSVLYRQHASNVLGGTPSRRQVWSRRIRRLMRRPQSLGYMAQAREFQRCFGDLLSPGDKRILQDFLACGEDLWTRTGYALRMDVRRQTWSDNAVLRGLIVAGRM
jgi:glycosyltransferase involved in cell wall biosynthesis